MRIAPVLVPHLRAPGADLWIDSALCAAITHNDRASIAASVAFVGIPWQLLGMPSVPPAEWWVSTYVAYAKPLEGETRYRPRGGLYHGSYEGPVWRFVAEQVPVAIASGKSTLVAANDWYSGAYLLETVPTALCILMRHAGDPEEAIIRAVDDTCDNDTIASSARRSAPCTGKRHCRRVGATTCWGGRSKPTTATCLSSWTRRKHFFEVVDRPTLIRPLALANRETAGTGRASG